AVAFQRAGSAPHEKHGRGRIQPGPHARGNRLDTAAPPPVCRPNGAPLRGILVSQSRGRGDVFLYHLADYCTFDSRDRAAADPPSYGGLVLRSRMDGVPARLLPGPV